MGKFTSSFLLLCGQSSSVACGQVWGCKVGIQLLSRRDVLWIQQHLSLPAWIYWTLVRQDVVLYWGWILLYIYTLNHHTSLTPSVTFPGVRRTSTNVSRSRAWTAVSVSTTWTASSACAIWITQVYTAKSMSATSTCTSSWACGRASSRRRRTSWYASTMSRKLTGYFTSTTKTPFWTPKVGTPSLHRWVMKKS